MNTDTLSRIGPDGRSEDIVTGLPGRGDHQANHPVVGPDGKLYFGVGSVTNAGVVGPDNFGYEWLPTFPQDHEIPGQDITLVGHNYASRDVLGSLGDEVHTGAYAPFGTETEVGQVVRGQLKCNGSVLRCNPDGSDLELVAWGLRNPYGIAFDPQGRLFVTEHGMDNRGARFIIGDYDDFYQIEEGAWYGWPDYASGIRLDDPYWGEGGRERQPVIANPPTTEPPRPFVSFEPHAGANGVSFAAQGRFGFAGDAFVALFGALFPITTPHLAAPAGFKVVRIDMRGRRIVDFAVNRIAGPASKLPHGGFERPSHCAFGPDGSLYVVDWGEIRIAPERGGIRMPARSGMLWRIRRTAAPAGAEPPRPLVVPLYGLQTLAALLGVFAAAALFGWLIARGLRRGRRR
jgi:glucose/arabinose dehydrogenase